MQKSIPCFLFALFLAIDCFAQQHQADTAAFRPYWEIGADLLPLINKENVPANSLFARRNYHLENGRGKALRLRAGVDVEVRDFSDVVHWTPSIFRTYAPFLSIGHEWQRSTKSYKWFAGIDGSVGLSRYNSFFLAAISDSLQEKVLSKEWNIGAVGLLGFQARLSPNISVSAEAALSVNYRHYTYDNDSYYGGIHSPGILSYETDKVLGAGIQPLYVINLIYSLKPSNHGVKK